MVEAPLKETLAAAVLMLGGAQPELPFIDPMCGSGTLAIEHALATRGIAGGHPPALRVRALADLVGGVARRLGPPARARRRAGRPRHAGKWPEVVCADVDPAALTAAHQNAAAAGVDDVIVFERADVADLQRRWPAATLATNPPYGERLQPVALDAIYRGMGQTFQRLSGWRAIVLSGNPALEQALPRKPAVSHRLWNGPLEARLLRYESVVVVAKLRMTRSRVDPARMSRAAICAPRAVDPFGGAAVSGGRPGSACGR